jgi:hypothetical protein
LSVGSGTKVRLDVSTLDGIDDPSKVDVYSRSTPNAGSFSELSTSYDSGDDELVATTGSFSEFVLASDSEPLPVELTNFEATLTEDRSVRLSWRTSSETNNAGFDVQRQTREEDGWEQIGYVESTADEGTSTSAQSYDFVVTDLPVGTHRFRLRQVDLDGSATLTDPVRVDVQMQQAATFSAPAPNPVSHTATLSFAVKESSNATVTLYNTLGQQVATLYEGTPPAEERQRIQFDASDLTSGVYFLRLTTGETTRTKRLTVVR